MIAAVNLIPNPLAPGPGFYVIEHYPSCAGLLGILMGLTLGTHYPDPERIIRDGWGYDFVGFLDHDLALGTNRYEPAIRRAVEGYTTYHLTGLRAFFG